MGPAMLLACALAAAPVELLTMGPGDDLYSKSGHAALCVLDATGRDGRCFNYGMANFSNPIGLGWDVLRGRAIFQVQAVQRQRLMQLYERTDRTVYRQLLPLSEEGAAAAARRMEHDALPENRRYRYHHIENNCATKLRDIIEEAGGGRLKRESDAAYGPSFRSMVRDGFGTHLGLLVLTEVIFGRPLEQRPTHWQAMFLPDALREEVRQRLGVEPELVRRRVAPLPVRPPAAGHGALAAAGAVLALIAALVARARPPRSVRVGRAIAAFPIGLLGLALGVLAMMSELPVMWMNELLLVFWASDLAVPFLGEPLLRRYLAVRFGVLAAAGAAAAVGVLVQPVWGPIACVAFALAGCAIAPAARTPRTSASTSST